MRGRNNKQRTTIGEIRSLVRAEFKRLIKEEWWAESYDEALVDDDAFNSKSVMVPDDIKVAIKKWMHAMCLDGQSPTR